MIITRAWLAISTGERLTRCRGLRHPCILSVVTADSRSPAAPLAIRITRPYATEDEYLEHELETLTRASITLVGAQPRAEGVVLRFELVLSSGQVLMRGEGRVTGFKPNVHQGLGGLSLRFTRLDTRSKALIDKAAALRDRRRPSYRPPSSAPEPPRAEPPPAPVPIPPSLSVPPPGRASVTPPPPPVRRPTPPPIRERASAAPPPLPPRASMPPAPAPKPERASVAPPAMPARASATPPPMPVRSSVSPPPMLARSSVTPPPMLERISTTPPPGTVRATPPPPAAPIASPPAIASAPEGGDAKPITRAQDEDRTGGPLDRLRARARALLPTTIAQILDLRRNKA
jgi:hypothetical protein